VFSSALEFTPKMLFFLTFKKIVKSSGFFGKEMFLFDNMKKRNQKKINFLIKFLKVTNPQ
jgi:hypothetical protein